MSQSFSAPSLRQRGSGRTSTGLLTIGFFAIVLFAIGVGSITAGLFAVSTRPLAAEAQGGTSGRYQSHPISNSSNVFVLDTQTGNYYVVSSAGPNQYVSSGPFKVGE